MLLQEEHEAGVQTVFSLFKYLHPKMKGIILHWTVCLYTHKHTHTHIHTHRRPPHFCKLTIQSFILNLTPLCKQRSPGLGVLDEYDSAKPAQRSSHTGPPGCIGWTRFQLPAYVEWRACTATPLSGVS